MYCLELVITELNARLHLVQYAYLPKPFKFSAAFRASSVQHLPFNKAAPMARNKICNRSMTPAEAKKAQHILTAKRRLQAGVEQRSNEETERAVARDAAKEALTTWYRTGFYKANARLPQIQIEDNLRDLRYVHGW